MEVRLGGVAMLNDWSAIKYVKTEDGWTTRILMPSLGGCSIKWSFDGNGIEGPLEEEPTNNPLGGVPVVIRTADASRPTAAQRKAFDHLVAQQSKIGKAVLGYLLAETRDTYLAEAVGPEDEWSAEDRKAIRRLRTVAGFRELVELTGASILPEEKDGTAYVVFDFNTALDEEHGLSVIVHRGQPLNFAGSGEDGGGVPELGGPHVDWNEIVTDITAYLTLLKSIKNVATATAAVEKVAAANALYRGALNTLEDLQNSILGNEAVFSTPQGPKAFRLSASVGDQYLRLGKKDDVAAVLDEPLGDDAIWRRCVDIARQYR